MTVALLLAVLAGAAMQRITGMGFAQVSAPFIILALGPAAGVVVVTILGLAASLMVLGRVRRDVEWSMVRRLLPGALLGIVVGTATAALLVPALAQVLAGVLIIVGLVGSLLIARAGTVPRTRGLVTGTGFASGAMGAIAGVGGPPMAVLAVLTRWNHIGFAATMQPFFIVGGIVTVTLRVLVEPSAASQLSLALWGLIAVALVLGIGAGELISKRLSAKAAHRLIVGLATAGAVATIIDGALGL